jgi:C1A family cysteine protease
VLQTLAQMKGCLAAGYPFVFGFSVYESFESPAVARTGKVPIPDPSEHSLGGHAVLAVGYDDAKQAMIVMNSWSDRWGDKGCFTLPYAYIADRNLADDFWTVRVVEGSWAAASCSRSGTN